MLRPRLELVFVLFKDGLSFFYDVFQLAKTSEYVFLQNQKFSSWQKLLRLFAENINNIHWGVEVALLNTLKNAMARKNGLYNHVYHGRLRRKDLEG
jgi:hypothetical protein